MRAVVHPLIAQGAPVVQLRSLLVVLTLLLPIAARAQSPVFSYVQARFGAVVPQHDDLEAFDAGPAFEVALGWFLNPNVAVEAAVGRFSVVAKDSFYDSGLGTTVSWKETASAVPVTGTLKLGVPLAGAGFLYGLGGVGLYFVRDEYEESAPGYGTGSVDDSDTTLGFHLGGGALARLNQQWAIGAELRYFMASVKLYDVKGNIDSVSVTGSLAYRF